MARKLRRRLVRGLAWAVGLGPVIQGGMVFGGGPVFCPPLEPYLSPTLVDFLLIPGFTFR